MSSNPKRAGQLNQTGRLSERKTAPLDRIDTGAMKEHLQENDLQAGSLEGKDERDLKKGEEKNAQ